MIIRTLLSVQHTFLGGIKSTKFPVMEWTQPTCGGGGGRDDDFVYMSTFAVAQELQMLCHTSETKSPFQVLLYFSFLLHFGHHNGLLCFMSNFSTHKNSTLLLLVNVFIICKVASKFGQLTQFGFIT